MVETNQPSQAVATLESPVTSEITAESEQYKNSKVKIHPDLIDPNKTMWKPLLSFFTPLMFSNILQSLGGVFSAAIIGHGLGETALAAASTILPVNFFLVSLVIGLGSGSLVLIGQAFGAGKRDEIQRTINTTIKFAFLLGVVMGTIGLVFLQDILQIIGAPTIVQPGAIQFGQVIFASLPMTFIYVAYTTILRGTGDGKTPFLFLLVSTSLNILLTPFLTFGWLGLPELGLRGAAVANISATVISFILLIIYLKRKDHMLAINRSFFKSLKLDSNILKLLIKIGLPSSVQMIAVSLSEIAVIFLVNEHGAQATAAYGAVIQIVNLVTFPMLSIGMAVGIFSAQLIGAGAGNRLDSLMRHALGLNYSIGIFIVGLVYILHEPILHWFLHDPITVKMARDVLYVVLWSLMILGHAMIISNLMRGTGTVIVPTAIIIVGIWAVMVPVAYLLSKPFALLGIWASYPISDSFMLIVLYLFYRFSWKRKQHQSLFV